MRPDTAQLGAEARERQDQLTGATSSIIAKAKVQLGARHIVNKTLRRAIADSYTAFIGQVDQVPTDVYGLALYALDTAYAPGHYQTGAHSFNLETSPFATSRAKHAAIHHAARKILHNLREYTSSVAPYCPPPLRSLGPGVLPAPRAQTSRPVRRRPATIHQPSPERQHQGRRHSSMPAHTNTQRAPPHHQGDMHTDYNASTTRHQGDMHTDYDANTSSTPSVPLRRGAPGPIRLVSAPGADHGHSPQQPPPPARDSTSRPRSRPGCTPMSGVEAARATFTPGPQYRGAQLSRTETAAVMVVAKAAAAEAVRKDMQTDVQGRLWRQTAEALLSVPASAGVHQPDHLLVDAAHAQLSAGFLVPMHKRVSAYCDSPHRGQGSPLSPEQYNAMLASAHDMAYDGSSSVRRPGMAMGIAHGTDHTHRHADGQAHVPRGMLQPGQCLAYEMGLTVSDVQLLRMINMHREVEEKQRLFSKSQGKDLDQAQQPFGVGIEGNPNRSRRLIPTDEQLAYGRIHNIAPAAVLPTMISAWEAAAAGNLPGVGSPAPGTASAYLGTASATLGTASTSYLGTANVGDGHTVMSVRASTPTRPGSPPSPHSGDNPNRSRRLI